MNKFFDTTYKIVIKIANALFKAVNRFFIFLIGFWGIGLFAPQIFFLPPDDLGNDVIIACNCELAISLILAPLSICFAFAYKFPWLKNIEKLIWLAVFVSIPYWYEQIPSVQKANQDINLLTVMELIDE